jgi:hypothetical protein
MSPSLTTWNRLEPRPRTVDSDTQRSLAAEVRDPLWMLTRQWQFGEFAGEDGGSIAWASVTTEIIRDASWGRTGTDVREHHPLSRAGDVPAQPIEEELERESLSDSSDLTLAVELGQLFEDLLAGVPEGTSATFLQNLRTAYPLPAAANICWDDADRFAEFCRGTVCNGWLVLDAIGSGDLLQQPFFRAEALHRIARQFQSAAVGIHGETREASQGTWKADALRHRGTVVASNGATQVPMSVSPGPSGEIDWYAFDTSAPPVFAATSNPTRYMVPGHVRFRGMPNARFWDFESAESDMGAVIPDVRELGKLLFMDFMLIQGNDWFTLPLPMEVGSICRIPWMAVHTVFGEDLTVPNVASRNPDWTMFSTTRREIVQVRDTTRPDCGPVVTEGLDVFLHLPASASRVLQAAPAVETVRLQRDEVANLAWAIEGVIPDRLGCPVPAREREVEPPGMSRTSLPDGVPPVQYVLQTQPPSWWFPLVPAQIDPPSSGQVRFRPGHLFRSEGRRDPNSRILKEMWDVARSVQIREEEIPKIGVQLHRSCQMARWMDGSLHVWCQRARRAALSEGSSGLRFDRLEPRR